MRAIGTMVVCVAALAMGACVSDKGTLPDADRTAIRAASEQYLKADDARDLDGTMRFIAEGAVYMPAGMPAIAGREAIRAFAQPHAWDRVEQAPQEIEGRDGLAFVRGSLTVHIQGRIITGNYIEIWQKQTDGAWKITRKVWNTDKSETR